MEKIKKRKSQKQRRMLGINVNWHTIMKYNMKQRVMIAYPAHRVKTFNYKMKF